MIFISCSISSTMAGILSLMNIVFEAYFFVCLFLASTSQLNALNASFLAKLSKKKH